MKKYIALAISIGLISGCTNQYVREYEKLCETQAELESKNSLVTNIPNAVTIEYKSDYPGNILLALKKQNIPQISQINSITIPVDQFVIEKYWMHTKLKLTKDHKYLNIKRKSSVECETQDIVNEFKRNYYGANKCFELTALTDTNNRDVLLYEVKSNNPDKFPRYDRESIYLNGEIVSTKSIYIKRSPHYPKPIGGYYLSCKDFK